MNTPKWAQDLVLDALLYLGGKGLNSDLPDIKWRHVLRESSSGCCHPTSITIIAGKDCTDSKLVILHELVHWVLPLKSEGIEGHPPNIYGHEGHTPRFWDLAWELYRWAKLPIWYCKWREGTYRKGALVAYHRNRKAIKQMAFPAHPSPGNHKHR